MIKQHLYISLCFLFYCFLIVVVLIITKSIILPKQVSRKYYYSLESIPLLALTTWSGSIQWLQFDPFEISRLCNSEKCTSDSRTWQDYRRSEFTQEYFHPATISTTRRATNISLWKVVQKSKLAEDRTNFVETTYLEGILHKKAAN